jgi:hypothetical protein
LDDKLLGVVAAGFTPFVLPNIAALLRVSIPTQHLQAAVSVEHLHGLDLDDRAIPGLLLHDRHVRLMAAEGPEV